MPCASFLSELRFCTILEFSVSKKVPRNGSLEGRQMILLMSRCVFLLFLTDYRDYVDEVDPEASMDNAARGDASKILGNLEWNPRVDFSEMLRRMVEF